MKKTGFTLAEVLISLSIVGVIAAITLPSLHLSVEKQKVGPALMKAVNTLEVANTVALQMENAVDLTDIYTGNGIGYLDGILVNYTKLVEVRPASGNDTGTYATKDGIEIWETISSEPSGEGTKQIKTFKGNPGSKLTGNFFKVHVDTNGKDRTPNIEGKDQFTLYVDTSGTVVPYGSKIGKDVSYQTDYESGWAAWYQANNAGYDNCPNNVKGETKVQPHYPESCAGSVVDNGGRLLYYYEGIEKKDSYNWK